MPKRLLLPVLTALLLFCATTVPARSPAPAPALRVDLNRASLEELLRVSGLTRSWAARIVRFRPYRTKRDLLDRGVLPPEVYLRIEDSVIAHRASQPQLAAQPPSGAEGGQNTGQDAEGDTEDPAANH